MLTPEEQAPLALPAGFVGGGQEAAPTTAGVVSDTPIPESQTAKMIDIAQVQGQVHAQSVQKVGELADKNPNEAVSIIRQWMNENAAA
jgi:flagellar M-ring protein FliF